MLEALVCGFGGIVTRCAVSYQRHREWKEFLETGGVVPVLLLGK